MPDRLTDIQRGIEAAKAALRATADGDDAGVLAALNETTHAEAVHAAAYLVAALREATATYVQHQRPVRRRRPLTTRRLLLAGVDETQDTAATQVAVLLNGDDRG